MVPCDGVPCDGGRESAAGNSVAHADGERFGALALTTEVVPGAVRVLA
jgi:diacylglycerol kinase family enzyme